MKQVVRKSNIELLRITAMLFVMIVHANFQALSTPTPESIRLNPGEEFVRIIIESFAIVCVDVFVLISGWFGIKFKAKSLFNLLFQVAFFSIIIYVAAIMLRLVPLGPKGIAHVFLLGNSYWFVKCYLILLILSPVLNVFVENSNKSQIAIVIIGLLTMSFVYDWIMVGTWYISGGSSPTGFVTLYLIGRYCNIYKPRFSTWSKYKDLGMYMLLSLVTFAGLFFPSLMLKSDGLSTYIFEHTLKYNSPFVIGASCYLLLFFSKLTFQCKMINWIACSAFAAYLFHSHFCVWDFIYSPIIKILYQYCPPPHMGMDFFHVFLRSSS